MAKPFNEPEVALLTQLGANPAWVSILNKMESFTRVERYDPLSSKPIENQTSDWVYTSGRLDEREIILGLLRLLKVKKNLEKTE